MSLKLDQFQFRQLQLRVVRQMAFHVGTKTTVSQRFDSGLTYFVATRVNPLTSCSLAPRQDSLSATSFGKLQRNPEGWTYNRFQCDSRTPDSSKGAARGDDAKRNSIFAYR